MINLVEILQGIETEPQFVAGGVLINATHEGKHVGRLTIEWKKNGRATVLAADAEPQREGIGTALYQAAKELLSELGIRWLYGALEGSGAIQTREKVFGRGRTHYFSHGSEISLEDAIHIMDVQYGRIMAVTRVK